MLHDVIPYIHMLRFTTTGSSPLYGRMWKALREIGKLFKSNAVSKIASVDLSYHLQNCMMNQAADLC